LAVEQARYEMTRARRQYDAVDPANRLIAAELERRWNQALTTQAELEAEPSSLQESREHPLTDSYILAAPRRRVSRACGRATD